MPKRETISYSNTTGVVYPTWEALIATEANGYVAVAIISDGESSWPWVNGPFDTEREAKNYSATLRRMANRGEFNDLTVKVFTRPAWKTNKERKANALKYARNTE